ncbi:hypothetical protein GJ496_011221 [Pomphorhynchus laevis]|nr:hypothetical protein GJ496_011221 [Pomphorhynchus laevis]
MPTNTRGLAPSQLKDLNLTNKWARDYEPSGVYNYNADPFLERNGEVDSTLVKLKNCQTSFAMLTLLDINLQIDHTYLLRALCRTRSHIFGICAGIGRSGTFAFVDIVLTLLAASEGCNSHAQLMNILHHLRNERPGLIQTPEQLRFCFLSIIRAFCDVNMKINPKWANGAKQQFENDSIFNLQTRLCKISEMLITKEAHFNQHGQHKDIVEFVNCFSANESVEEMQWVNRFQQIKKNDVIKINDVRLPDTNFINKELEAIFKICGKLICASSEIEPSIYFDIQNESKTSKFVMDLISNIEKSVQHEVIKNLNLHSAEFREVSDSPFSTGINNNHLIVHPIVEFENVCHDFDFNDKLEVFISLSKYAASLDTMEFEVLVDDTNEPILENVSQDTVISTYQLNINNLIKIKSISSDISTYNNQLKDMTRRRLQICQSFEQYKSSARNILNLVESKLSSQELSSSSKEIQIKSESSITSNITSDMMLVRNVDVFKFANVMDKQERIQYLQQKRNALYEFLHDVVNNSNNHDKDLLDLEQRRFHINRTFDNVILSIIETYYINQRKLIAQSEIEELQKSIIEEILKLVSIIECYKSLKRHYTLINPTDLKRQTGFSRENNVNQIQRNQFILNDDVFKVINNQFINLPNAEFILINLISMIKDLICRISNLDKEILEKSGLVKMFYVKQLSKSWSNMPVSSNEFRLSNDSEIRKEKCVELKELTIDKATHNLQDLRCELSNMESDFNILSIKLKHIDDERKELEHMKIPRILQESAEEYKKYGNRMCAIENPVTIRKRNNALKRFKLEQRQSFRHASGLSTAVDKCHKRQEDLKSISTDFVLTEIASGNSKNREDITNTRKKKVHKYMHNIISLNVLKNLNNCLLRRIQENEQKLHILRKTNFPMIYESCDTKIMNGIKLKIDDNKEKDLHYLIMNLKETIDEKREQLMESTDVDALEELLEDL